MEQPRFQYFLNEEMTNDEYHAAEGWVSEYVSGSSLAEIHEKSPASWKYKEREETKALAFGTQSHTMMLEVEKFESLYARGVMAGELKDCITSQTALAAKLKSCGLIGTSGKGYPELLVMAAKNDIDVNVLWLEEMIAEWNAKYEGKELIKAEDYDACKYMRQTLLNIPRHAATINSKTALRELSIFGTIFGVKVKVRLDHVDTITDPDIIRRYGYDPEVHPEIVVITDYKTTQSVKPSEFGRHAFNLGYYLKMALQRDLFKAAFDEKRPIVIRFLAQEKKMPFLPLGFTMNQNQLVIGRQQYTSVIHLFAECQKHDVWPSYENNADEVELPTPEFVKYQFKELFAQDS